MRQRMQEVLAEAFRAEAVDARALRKAEQEADRSGRPLDEVLVESGTLSREAFFRALAAVAGVPAFDLARSRIRYGDAQLVPREVSEKRQLLAVEKNNGRLVVAMVDPDDAFALQQVSALTGLEVETRVTWEPDLLPALEKAYSVKVERITADTPHGASVERKPREGGTRFVAASREPRKGPVMQFGRVTEAQSSRTVSLGLVSPQPAAPAPLAVGTVDPASLAAVLDSLARPEADPAAWLARLAAVARHLCHAGAAVLYRLEAGQSALGVAAADGLAGESWPGLRVPLDEKSLPGWAFVERREILTNEAARDPHACPEVQQALGLAVRSTVLCPVTWEGRALGCLQVLNGPAQGFQEAHRVLLRALAAQAALVMVTCRALESTRGIERRVVEGLRALGEMSGTQSRGHGELVSRMAVTVGREAGCAEGELEVLRRAGHLHDLGCMGGRADHAARGGALLEDSGLLADLAPAVRHHHDRWDGTGPPGTLGGQEIPRLARILAVAEAWIETLEREGAARRRQVLADMVADFGTRYDPALKIPFQIAVEEVTPAP